MHPFLEPRPNKQVSHSESTFEHSDEPILGPAPESPLPASAVDLDKTVIRHGEPINVGGLAQGINEADRLTRQDIAEYLVGEKLDHYQIESLIGSGGMGAVFRGRDLRLDREVAIKVVPNLGRDAESLRRFRVEAQSAAKLDHPNIARVYYVGETDAWSYIVFEFIEGVNLRDIVLRRGQLSIDEAIGLTRQVAEALQHASERRVVHRDIKPSNILVTPQGQAKVVDMGLARTTELDRSTNDLTASGVTLGTFDYISPEQAHDPRAADVRSDVYSLGCTLYFLLTGQPPFPEGTALQKLLLHGSKLPEDPRNFRSDISDSLIAILRKMMAKKPIDRYQEPNDLIHDLRTLSDLEGLTWSLATDSTSIAAASYPRTWFETLFPIGVAGLCMVAVTTWLYISSYQSAAFQIPREEIPADRLATIESRPVGLGTESTDSITDSSVLPIESERSPSLHEARNASVADSIDNIAEERVDRTGAAMESDSLLGPSPNTSEDLASTVIVDSAGTSGIRTLEQAFDAVNARHELKTISLAMSRHNTSLSELRDMLVLEHDVTIESVKSYGQERALWVIDGSESPMEPADSTAVIDCFESRVLIKNVDIRWNVSTMSRRRSLFSVMAGGAIRLQNCTITLHDDRMAPSSGRDSSAAASIIEIRDSMQANGESFGFSPRSENQSKSAIQIEADDCSFRGQCHWLSIDSPLRTEVSLNNCWLALSGSMIEASGSRDAARTFVPLRLDMKNVSVWTASPWLTCRLSNSRPYPISFVRTANHSVFAGSETLIEWNATDLTDARSFEQVEGAPKLLKWVDLRGLDNVYDSNTIDELLSVRMSNGRMSQVVLDLDSAVFSMERGMESVVNWKKSPPVNPLKLHETGFEQFELATQSIQIGYTAKP
jgi:eukaryotic-like serine/threonine-protein kinase